MKKLKRTQLQKGGTLTPHRDDDGPWHDNPPAGSDDPGGGCAICDCQQSGSGYWTTCYASQQDKDFGNWTSRSYGGFCGC